MDSMVVFAIGLAALIAFIAALWYLFQTVRVMWGYSSLLAVVSVFFSPLVHIGFYFFPKDDLDDSEKDLFKKYFLSIAAICVIGVVASSIIPTSQRQIITNNYNQDSYQDSQDFSATDSVVYENVSDDQDTWVQEQIADDETRQQEIARFVAENRAPQRSLMYDESFGGSADYSSYYERAPIENPQPISSIETEPSYSSQDYYEPQYNTPVAIEAAPSAIVNCDTAGCWDTSGTRYNKGAGDTYFPSTGGVCQNVGGQMQCN